MPRQPVERHITSDEIPPVTPADAHHRVLGLVPVEHSGLGSWTILPGRTALGEAVVAVHARTPGAIRERARLRDDDRVHAVALAASDVPSALAGLCLVVSGRLRRARSEAIRRTTTNVVGPTRPAWNRMPSPEASIPHLVSVYNRRGVQDIVLWETLPCVDLCAWLETERGVDLARQLALSVPELLVAKRLARKRALAGVGDHGRRVSLLLDRRPMNTQTIYTYPGAFIALAQEIRHLAPARLDALLKARNAIHASLTPRPSRGSSLPSRHAPAVARPSRP